jgi:hypothetical protein
MNETSKVGTKSEQSDLFFTALVAFDDFKMLGGLKVYKSSISINV